MHKLIWESEGVYWKYHGDVTGKEVIDASVSIYSDSRFDEISYKLVDFSDVVTIQMDANEIATVACMHKAAALSNPYIKTAIIINDVKNQRAKYFTSFFKGSNWEVEIFEDLSKAYDWVERND
ncbi:MAG: hypothetical protein DIZ80_04020 [endosymbiont of Galathealinum brachiosum]|uniref:STAS/SEC14 domain-containing protein n=1 Tax=endosymbiont of Galathealinum brachiosum TaxID=2200906 RepID=A0A370DI97_9GAMM|nr:MAG: hypothetical protein DIZ80_04020 [endosymbiont of Galathealinum brachiosum]